MAKLVGPLLSKVAHGSIADTLIYLAFPLSSQLEEMCRVHMAVQKYHKPKGEDSEKQIAWKENFKEVANTWKTLTEEEQETWRIAGRDIRKRDICSAAAVIVMGYEMFMSFNLFGKGWNWAIAKTAPAYGTVEWAQWFLAFGNRQLKVNWRHAVRVLYRAGIDPFVPG